eukprot:5913426-Prymnesium_polylepis.1
MEVDSREERDAWAASLTSTDHGQGGDGRSAGEKRLIAKARFISRRIDTVSCTPVAQCHCGRAQGFGDGSSWYCRTKYAWCARMRWCLGTNVCHLPTACKLLGGETTRVTPSDRVTPLFAGE